jgi:signal transduction histidine kinase
MARRSNSVTIADLFKDWVRTLFNTNLKYIVLLVIFVAIAVIWVFGTLPWVLINQFLCFPEAGIACENPQQVSQTIRTILAIDIGVISLSIGAIYLIQHLRRTRQ